MVARPYVLTPFAAVGGSPALATATFAFSRSSPLLVDSASPPADARESTSRSRGTASAATLTVLKALLTLRHESVSVTARDRRDAPDRERQDDMPSVDDEVSLEQREGARSFANDRPSSSAATTSAARHGGRGKHMTLLLLPVAATGAPSRQSTAVPDTPGPSPARCPEKSALFLSEEGSNSQARSCCTCCCCCCGRLLAVPLVLFAAATAAPNKPDAACTAVHWGPRLPTLSWLTSKDATSIPQPDWWPLPLAPALCRLVDGGRELEAEDARLALGVGSSLPPPPTLPTLSLLR